MEFIIDNECFRKAISDVSKAVSLKTAFPILTGIKIMALPHCLILIGSNSDIMIEKVIPLAIDGIEVLEVKHTGNVVISAKYVSEIVKKLPDKIHITVDENQVVTIQSDEIVTNLYGFNADDYPSLPQFDEDHYIKIHSIELVEMIKQTAFSVSKSETRPVLTGVHIVFQDNHLSCVATDSHRLSLRKLEIESNVNGALIVPSTSLIEISKLVSDEAGFITIFVTDRYIVFRVDTISFYSRLIEGNYPNTSRLLPSGFKTVMTLNTKQLLKGIDRACLFASDWKNNNVHLEVQNNKLRISSNSSEIGKIEETQTIKEMNGETDVSISLDGNFLMDVLKVINEEEVKLSFGGSMRPVLIEPIENASYLHLISPVRS